MLNAIEPKSPIKFVGGMQFVSPARGLMAAVTGDLGAIFTADDFVLPLADLGIETASTPPRMPELKGRIENLNGVVKSWMRMRRRGASPDGRPRGEEGNEVDGADEVVMSLEDFERRVDLTLRQIRAAPAQEPCQRNPVRLFQPADEKR